MKIISSVIFFILFIIDVSNSNEIKLKEIKIDTKKDTYKKFKSQIRGQIESIDYINQFFEFTEDNRLKGFIEIFDLDNAGLYQGRVNMWFRRHALIDNKKEGCINSNENIFFKIIDNNTNITCLNIKIISKDKLSHPKFKPDHQVSLWPRQSMIKNFIKKNEIIVPDKMIRSEHYFYKEGQVNWIFFSHEININSDEDINNFINQSFQNHKNFEKQLKISKKNRFLFESSNFDKKTKNTSKKVIKKYNIKGQRSIALSWEGYDDLLVGTIKFNESDYKGTIKLLLPNTDEMCEGTYSLQKNMLGTWQIACTNNMGAAGTLKVNNDGSVTGVGSDYNKKKVKFTVSKK